jgi:enamine deaminase RidA (YjgF/YER057c/UK114 family)
VPDSGRRLISSGAPWERSVGYSRALVVGRHVFVSGTAPVMADGAPPPEDAYGQAKRCLEIVESALVEAGASFSDVVRTRLYLTTLEAFEGVGRAHAEAFADVRPTSTAVVVEGLVDPRWLVEIEVDAILPGT